MYKDRFGNEYATKKEASNNLFNIYLQEFAINDLRRLVSNHPDKILDHFWEDMVDLFSDEMNAEFATSCR